MRPTHHALLASLFVALLALAACGGGGGGAAPEDDDPVVRNLPPKVDRLVSAIYLSRDATESIHGVREDAFVDPEGEPVTVRADRPNGESLPDWITFDPATMRMVISQVGAPVGVTTIRFRGTDPAGGEAQFLTSIHVPSGLVLGSGSRTVVSRPNGPGQADGLSYGPSVSGLGQYVAFITRARNLHPAQSASFDPDVLVKHVADGAIEIVNSGSDGLGGDGRATRPAISFDGRKVAFQDDQPWIGDPTDGEPDVFLKDLAGGALTWLSPPLFGSQDAGSYDPSISAEADFVAFWSESGLLVTDDSNGIYDTFVRDVAAGSTSRTSLLSDGSEVTGESFDVVVSADARFVAFGTDAGEFYGASTGTHSQIVVKDLRTGAVEIVSRNGSDEVANSGCALPSISADGRFVAFYTRATNLDPQDTDDLSDVYVRDRWTDQLRWVTQLEGGPFAGPVTGGSHAPKLSADGRTVLFASNRRLVSLDDNDVYDAYLKVLERPVWRLLTQRTVAGVVPEDVRDPDLSANAAAAACAVDSDDLSSADTNGRRDVVLIGTGLRGGTLRDDDLQGSSDDDWLRGLAGHDRILGGEGNDLIEPGPGVDEMRGGLGVDTYLWWSVDEGIDSIVDFQIGILGDRLDLRRILPAGASADATDHVRFLDDGVNTTVEVDVDGPGGAPFAPLVLLRDVSPFTLQQALDGDQLLLP